MLLLVCLDGQKPTCRGGHSSAGRMASECLHLGAAGLQYTSAFVDAGAQGEACSFGVPTHSMTAPRESPLCYEAGGEEVARSARGKTGACRLISRYPILYALM